jgi:hypothetical protein
MLGFLGWNHTAAIYMLLFPWGYRWMKLTERMDSPGWNQLMCKAISDGLHTAAIYIHAAVSIGLPAYRV